MPPKRKRGGARGRARVEKEKSESLDVSTEDLAGEEEEGEAEDSFTEDKSAQGESTSELEMSVNLDKSQEKESGEIAFEGKDEEGKGNEGGLLATENVETSKEDEKKAIETTKEQNPVKTDSQTEEDKYGEEKAQKGDSKTEDEKESLTKEEKTSKQGASEKKAGLLETPETRYLESIDTRSVKVEPIEPFDVKEMRSRWKWSIRINGVRPEDIPASELMTMPRVKDSYYCFSQQRNGEGQMELCTKTTNDTILAMLRVLRSPFCNRMLTIEVTKRTFIKLDGKKTGLSGEDSTSGAADSIVGESKPVQESADGEIGTDMIVDPEAQGTVDKKEDTKTEEGEKKNEEELDEDDDGEPTESDKKGSSFEDDVIWGEARETAAFVVNLNRIQKINLKTSRKLKGDMVRRSVYVGCLPKRTTEEMLKVIFPVANSIIMKPADDPNMRHTFLETTHHANCVGFVMSYVGLQVNGQELKLSMRQQDLSMLKLEDKEKKDVKKEGDDAEEEKNKETGDKVDKTEEEKVEVVEMDSAKEVEEEKDEKVEESEKMDEENTEGKEKDHDKKQMKENEGKGAHKEFSDEEKKLRAQLNRQKKKRKREFMEEVQREWSAKKPRHNMPKPPPVGMGPRVPFGPPQRRGPFGMGPGDGGNMMGAFAPPLMHLQEKVSSLLRLQNQLEKTIGTQMEFIQTSEVAARQQAEHRIREMAMISQELGFGLGAGMGKGAMSRGRGGLQQGGASPRGRDGSASQRGRFSGSANRSFGGFGSKAGGNKQRDFHRSPSRTESSFEFQAQEGGFNKRFRKSSDSRYDNRSDYGDGQGNTFFGQKKFGQGGKAFGNESFGGMDDSGNQFGDGGFGTGGNFGGGKNKFGRGGKFGGRTSQMGGGNQMEGSNFGGGNQIEGGLFGGGNQMGGGKFGGGNQMGGGKFGGGNQMGGGKFGGGSQTGGKFGGGNQTGGGKFGGNQKGGGKFGRGKKFGGGNFGGNQTGGSDFGSGGSKFSAGGNKGSGRNFGGSGGSFGGEGMSMESNFGVSNQSWGTGLDTTTGFQNYSVGNFGSSFGSGVGSFNTTGYNAGGTGGQQNWNYSQNQW